MKSFGKNSRCFFIIIFSLWIFIYSYSYYINKFFIYNKEIGLEEEILFVNPFSLKNSFLKRMKPINNNCNINEIFDHYGVCYPCSYDCSPPRMGKNYLYEYYLPSRKYECDFWCKNNTNQRNYFDIIDEEFFEKIYLDKSFVTTKDYIIMEYGARYGTWGLKGAKYAELFNYENIKSFYCETQPFSLPYLKKNLNRNLKEKRHQIIFNFNYIKSSEELLLDFKNILNEEQTINYIDMDCQGCERFLDHENIFDFIKHHVLILRVEAHSIIIFENLKKRFEDLIIYSLKGYDYKDRTLCDGSLLANTKKNIDLEVYKELFLAKVNNFITMPRECLEETPFGPIYVRDNIIIIFNEKLINDFKLKRL